jgi:hypothetical protein
LDTLASGVGGRQVDADFGDQEGLGRPGVGIIAWKGGSLGLRKPQNRQKRVPSLIAEALNSKNPTGRLHSAVLACVLPVGRKSKVEILVKEASYGKGNA